MTTEQEMSDKHTPEPWKWTSVESRQRDYGRITTESGSYIADVCYEKDARRIVNCINACADKTDDDLQGHLFAEAELSVAVELARRNAEKQRDELLAQISNMYDCIFMADDNAAGHGYDADSSIRRHLGYAMTIANKAKAGEKQ